MLTKYFDSFSNESFDDDNSTLDISLKKCGCEQDSNSGKLQKRCNNSASYECMWIHTTC